MRYATGILFVALVFATGAQGQQQQPPNQPALGRLTPTPIEPLDIYQIDLIPSGTGFALTKPVLDGNVYVFKVWPDRATVRLPVSRVKKMIARTKDINDEVIYQIDLVPTGQMIARDDPKLKGTTYVFHTWREGTLMSIRQTDVKKVSRVTGLPAFKIHLQLLGASAIENLPMEGGGTVRVISEAPTSGETSAIPDQSQTPSNWIYQGVPGVTDAWAPPSAVVRSPGDVPRAPQN